MSPVIRSKNSNNLNSQDRQKKKTIGRVGECRHSRFSYCSLAPSFGDVTNPNEVGDGEETTLTPDVTGFGLWLKADNSSLLLLNDNDPISPWPDDSGSIPANNAIADGATNRPAFKKNILNGLPGVFFDGTSDFLRTINFAQFYTEGEVFVLFKNLLDVPVDAFKSGFWDFEGTVDAAHMPFTSGNIFDNFGSTTRRNIGNPTPDLTNPTLYNVVTKSGEWTARLNNSVFFTTATNTVGFNNAMGYTVGMSFSGTSGNVYFNGYFFELILYPFVLTAPQRAAVVSYFNTKWGTSF